MIEENNTRLAEKKFEVIIEVSMEIKAKSKFQTEKPSVLHTKHNCTKSGKNGTIWESPYLLVPFFVYKN